MWTLRKSRLSCLILIFTHLRWSGVTQNRMSRSDCWLVYPVFGQLVNQCSPLLQVPEGLCLFSCFTCVLNNFLFKWRFQRSKRPTTITSQSSVGWRGADDFVGRQSDVRWSSLLLQKLLHRSLLHDLSLLKTHPCKPVTGRTSGRWKSWAEKIKSIFLCFPRVSWLQYDILSAIIRRRIQIFMGHKHDRTQAWRARKWFFFLSSFL